MRILLWHGYLLGGTGSNVYTRQLAREWRRAGHDVTVLSQDPRPDEYDLGGATTVRPDVGGLLPTFVLDRYEGYEVRLVQDCTRAELDAWVEANAAAVRALLPADLVFANHVLLGGPVGAGIRRPVRRQGPRVRARVLDAREPRSCRRGERRRSPARARRSSARGTSGRCSRTSAGTSTACTRSRRASTSTSGSRSPGRSPSPACSRRPRATGRTRGTARSGSPTTATPSGSPRSSPATCPRSSTSAS